MELDIPWGFDCNFVGAPFEEHLFHALQASPLVFFTSQAGTYRSGRLDIIKRKTVAGSLKYQEAAVRAFSSSDVMHYLNNKFFLYSVIARFWKKRLHKYYKMDHGSIAVTHL